MTLPLPLLLDDAELPVELLGRRPLQLRISGSVYDIEESAAEPGAFSIVVDGQRVHGYRHVERERVWIRLGGRTFVVGRQDPLRARAGAGGGRDQLKADMPGTVVAIHKKEGERVTAGEPILTVESMKLQATIAADHEATIASIAVTANGTFERGAVLVVLASEAKS